MTNHAEATQLRTPDERAGQIRARLEEWGYVPASEAPADLVRMAEDSLEAQRVGDLVVKLGYATRDQVEKLLQNKPRNVLALQYLAEHVDNLRPNIQLILALTEALPYFSTLPQIGSTQLKQPAIFEACQAQEAILIDTPSGRPCLVFTEHQRLKTYERMARHQRANDPIFKLCENGPILGLGQRTEIHRLLSTSDSTDLVANDESDQIRLFIPAQAETETQKLFVRMIDFAASKKSSNIALHPQRDGIVRARYRRSGKMYDIPVVRALNPDQAQELNQFLHRISAARYTDSNKLVEGRLQAPADGQVIYRSSEAELFLRLSFTAPDSSGLTNSPESVSIRLIPRTTARVNLRDNNLRDETIEAIQAALTESQGMVLTCGPTNTGKSTTLAGAFTLYTDMYGEEKVCLSAEQPIERDIPGLIQHNVDQRNTYDILTAAQLRQDPDLIYVGEIRSRSSAAAATRAAGTGALVLSTIHTMDSVLAYQAIRAYITNTHIDNASAAVVTIHDLIESMNLVIAQRLLPRLCECSVVIDTERFEQHKKRTIDYCARHNQKMPNNFMFRRLAHSHKANPKGCEKCDGTGYAGEVPINETLIYTRELKTQLHQMEERGTFRYDLLARARPYTLFDDALNRVLSREIELCDAWI